MLCENCNENEANVKYTQIVNGVKKEMHLCYECANKLGIGNMDFHIPDFTNFFGDLLNDYSNDFMPSIAKPKGIVCDKCGLKYDEFIETSKFGCDHCYSVFEEKIDPILKRLHGSNRYIGKKAKKEKKENKLEIKEEKKEQNKIDELKLVLKQKIKEEKYEEAAKIRDEIKRLEK